jgi:hypothetical protein
MSRIENQEPATQRIGDHVLESGSFLFPNSEHLGHGVVEDIEGGLSYLIHSAVLIRFAESVPWGL